MAGAKGLSGGEGGKGGRGGYIYATRDLSHVSEG